MCRRPSLRQSLAERLDAIPIDQNRPHEKRRVVADLGLAAKLDDMLVPELLDDLGFVANTRALVGVAGDLQDQRLAGPLDQERDRAGPLPQALEHLEIAGERAPLLGESGVGDKVAIGGRELIFNLVEPFQKVGGRVEAVVDLGVGRELDQILKRFAGPVQGRADLEALGLAQLGRKLQSVGRRGLARKQVIGDCTQREDIEVLADFAAARDRLGCQVGRAGIFDESVDMRRRRDGRGAPDADVDDASR